MRRRQGRRERSDIDLYEKKVLSLVTSCKILERHNFETLSSYSIGELHLAKPFMTPRLFDFRVPSSKLLT